MPVLNYDWDDLEDNIVEEYDDGGVTVAEYTTEPNLYGNVISQNRGGVESQFHFDALGFTLALTDNQQGKEARRFLKTLDLRTAFAIGLAAGKISSATMQKENRSRSAA